MLRHGFIGFLIILSAGTLQAQFNSDQAAGDTANFPYWVQMMQDPDAKFRDTQRAFEKYWENRTDIRHNGWKVFRRWEYISRNYVQPDGRLPSPDQVLKEYNRYFASRDGSLSTGGNWTETGPVSLPENSTYQPNGMGRVNAISFHPINPEILYAGAPSGGLWRSTNGGSTWKVLTTDIPTLGVSAILIHPTNPNIILIGTGDRDGNDAPGMGVYKSTDGGMTWTASNTGMGNVTVGMMIMHPANPAVILAATSGGIFKSADGGATWVKKSTGLSNYKDIRFKPGDPSVVFATGNSAFYRSVNTGDSWTQVTSGILTGTRLVIGVCPSQPSTVYLCVTSGTFIGLQKSTDCGLTFSTQSTAPNIMDDDCAGTGTSGQAWYDLCITVDPNDAHTLYVGGINIWKSVNSGVTWTIKTHWVGSSWGTTCAPSVHADIHCLEWSPVNGVLFTGCDGGVYKSIDAGANWNDLSSGLGIAQVYKIGQSATKQSLCMSGYQDNGTSVHTGSTFTTVIGGDGMECLVDYSDTSFRYGELYDGQIMRSTGSDYYTIAANGSHGITETGGWVTPYFLDETIPSTMFAGYVNVWKSTNVKNPFMSLITWSKISDGESGTCSVLEQSPANADVMYAVRNNSLKRTDNANDATPAWFSCTLPGGITPSDIETHPTDQNVVYATAGNKVYKSADKGTTWTDISGSLPAIGINCIVYERNSNEGLYIGNRTNVFFRDAGMIDWIPFSSGLPPVNVRELEIYYDSANPANNRIKAATYGRGLWQSDLYYNFLVLPSNQAVPDTAGTTWFNISAGSSAPWTATSSVSWCTVTPAGSGSGTVTCNYETNPTGDSRIAIIRITPGGNIPVQKVTVTQAEGHPMLSVFPSGQNVAATPDSTVFMVTSNTNWTAISNAAWCSVPASGSGNESLVVHCTENPSAATRTADITITVSFIPAVVVTVTQSGLAPVLSVTPPEKNVSPHAGSTEYTVTSNTSWTAVADSAWCTVTPSGTGSGTLVAGYEENPYHIPRGTTITVTAADLSPRQVTLTQSQSTYGVDEKEHGITISPNPTTGRFRIVSPGNPGEQMEITVTGMTGKITGYENCRITGRGSFDLTAFPEGCYFVKIKTGMECRIHKLVVIR